MDAYQIAVILGGVITTILIPRLLIEKYLKKKSERREKKKQEQKSYLNPRNEAEREREVQRLIDEDMKKCR